jgi:hypothetical protein
VQQAERQQTSNGHFYIDSFHSVKFNEQRSSWHGIMSHDSQPVRHLHEQY